MLKLSVLIIFISGFFSVCSAETPLRSITELTSENETIKHNPINKNEIATNQILKLLVWNIYKQGRTNLVKDLKNFSIENDILILQEIHLTESFEENIQGPTLSRHHFITAPSFNWDGYPTGVATTTRYNYLQALPLKSPVSEPILNTPKMSLYVSLPILGAPSPLMIGNVHGINFVGQTKFAKHMKQVFDTLKSHPGPIVLAGDFNTRNRTRMDLVKKLASEINLKIIPLDNDNRRTKLDLVLARGVNIVSAKLLPEIKSSDHPPIQLSLVVPVSIYK